MKGIDFQIETFRIQNRLSYIDSVVEFADRNDIDIYDLAELLHESIKNNIEYEAKSLNLLKDNDIETSLSKFFK